MPASLSLSSSPSHHHHQHHTMISPMKQQQQQQSVNSASSSSSQNITESVPVPSSEHVAEIVGRQGCKIKALRAKTNTYIKTPIRGEAPMFVITGRREDVMTAKREIQLAADHFSQIRARRGSGGSQTSSDNIIMAPKSPKLNSGSSSSASISPSDHSTTIVVPVTTASILTAKPSQIIQQQQHQQQSNTVLLPRASSVSPGSLASLNTDLFSSQTQQQQQQQQQPPIYMKPPTYVAQPQPIPINQSMSTGSCSSQSGSPPTNSISKKVTVPYQVVGLVVGPKGSTIKRIQQSTNTYIVTPSRDSQPVFEIQGQAECVEAAKAEIENYIMMRTTTSGVSSSSSSASSSCSSKEDFCCSSLSALMIADSHLSDYVSNLISPQSSSLFQSVASVVDDYVPAAVKTDSASYMKSDTNNPWSSSSGGVASSNQLCSIADDLVNSLINSGRSACSSSSSSSSASTSSSFSSSSSSSANDHHPVIAHQLATIYDFQSSNGLDNSSGASSTTSSSDLVFNSLFQHARNTQFDQQLLFSALNHPNDAQNNDFYYFNNPTESNNFI